MNFISYFINNFVLEIEENVVNELELNIEFVWELVLFLWLNI